MLNIKSLDEYAEQFGSKWAYHLEPVLKTIHLPYYEDMKLAKMDGWDLVDEHDEPWPWPDLTLPSATVNKSHLQAFVAAKEIRLHHHRVRPDRDFKRCVRFQLKPETERLRPSLKSWLELTVKDD